MSGAERSTDFSPESSEKCTVMPISNSPHPVSVTSYGGFSSVLAASLNEGCRLNTTLEMTCERSSFSGPRRYTVHLCEWYSSAFFPSQYAHVP